MNVAKSIYFNEINSVQFNEACTVEPVYSGHHGDHQK